MALNKKSKAQLENEDSFNLYNERFKHLALNMFEWSGLPESIPSYYIEKVLYRDGQILFFNDALYGFMALPCSEVGGQNPYGEYTQFRATGFNYNNVYSIDNSVCIWNNPSRAPTSKFVDFFASKLMKIERSIDVNLNVIRVPWIIKGSTNTLLTMKNIYDKVERNEPVIYTDKSLTDTMEILQTNAEYHCDRLADLKHDYINDVATFFGIKNANTDKRERLITEEVNANNDFTMYNVDFMLECRKKACEELNAMFGLNMSVDLKIKEEVETDGKIYPGTSGSNDP